MFPISYIPFQRELAFQNCKCIAVCSRWCPEMGGNAIEAEAKSLNIITRTMQKKRGDWYKHVVEITSGKGKGRKLQIFFLSSAADGDIATSVYSNWHALLLRGSCICLQSIHVLCYSHQFESLAGNKIGSYPSFCLLRKTWEHKHLKHPEDKAFWVSLVPSICEEAFAARRPNTRILQVQFRSEMLFDKGSSLLCSLSFCLHYTDY